MPYDNLPAVPKLRNWKSRRYFKKIGAVFLMMVEPNSGQKLLDQVTISDTDKRAGEGANKDTEKFYEVYNQVGFHIRSTREM